MPADRPWGGFPAHCGCPPGSGRFRVTLSQPAADGFPRLAPFVAAGLGLEPLVGDRPGTTSLNGQDARSLGMRMGRMHDGIRFSGMKLGEVVPPLGFTSTSRANWHPVSAQRGHRAAIRITTVRAAFVSASSPEICHPRSLPGDLLRGGKHFPRLPIPGSPVRAENFPPCRKSRAHPGDCRPFC